MTTSLIGGVLIGLAAVWLYVSLGRVAGISGIAGRVLADLRTGEFEWWPVLFIVGLGAGGWLAYAVAGPRPEVTLNPESFAYLISAGVLVGFGTRLGSGCTSGHGVCGMARLSKRSIAATATFLAVGILTATGLSVL